MDVRLVVCARYLEEDACFVERLKALISSAHSSLVARQEVLANDDVRILVDKLHAWPRTVDLVEVRLRLVPIERQIRIRRR